MQRHLFWNLLVGFTISITVYVSAKCKLTPKSSRYKLCSDIDNDNIYPGRIKKMAQELYIPQGLTTNACIEIQTPSDMAVIISDAYLEYQNDTLTTTKGVYNPEVTRIPEKHLLLCNKAAYHFGDIDCNGSSVRTSEDNNRSNIFCYVKLTIEFLMANIADVSENTIRTVITTFVSENVTIDVASALVLSLLHNSSKISSLSTDIPDGEMEFAKNTLKRFNLQAMFRNPLSKYKLVLTSSSTLLIAPVRIRSVGKHFSGIIAKTKAGLEHEDMFCQEEPVNRTIDFGFVPNKGAFDVDALAKFDIVNFEVISLLTSKDEIGKINHLRIRLEVDGTVVMDTTKYFKVTEEIPIDKINITVSQNTEILPKSGKGLVKLAWDIPSFSNGLYKMHASSKRYAGSGGDGLQVEGIQVSDLGSNIQCISHSTHWKLDTNPVLNILSMPYFSTADSNRFGFLVSVIAVPHLLEAKSSHLLTFEVYYPGQRSPQSHKLYFNISDQEIFTTRYTNGEIPMNIYLYEECQSMSFSTEVFLILETKHHQSYGRLILELAIDTVSAGYSLDLCDFDIWRGKNVFGDFFTNITRRNDRMFEVLVDISPLTNVFVATYDGTTVNYFLTKIVLKHTDNEVHTNNNLKSIKARITSNDISIWTGELTTKSKIQYYPDFIVLTKIMKTDVVIPEDIWFHYSHNGSYFQQEIVVWEKDSNVYVLESPKVIAYFYFSTTPCTVICNVTAVWEPLKQFITVIKDDNNTLFKMIPYALDQDLNTCFDLPVPGNSPSMLWLIIKDLSLFNVTSQKFVVHVTGEDITCGRVGQKSIQVGTSGPANSEACSDKSDVLFCNLMSHSSNSTLTQCDFVCVCEDLLQCSNVHFVMQSANKDAWRLCELTITDVL